MTFAVDILSLLFHPKEFFADASRTQSFRLPLLYTAVYGIFAAVAGYQVSAASADLIGMPDAAGVLGAVGAVTGFIMTFLIWVIVAAFFFVFVKFITHTTAGFAAAGNVPVRAVFTALLIPIIMAAYTAYETYTTIESLKTLAATGGMQMSMQPPR